MMCKVALTGPTHDMIAFLAGGPWNPLIARLPSLTPPPLPPSSPPAGQADNAANAH